MGVWSCARVILDGLFVLLLRLGFLLGLGDLRLAGAGPIPSLRFDVQQGITESRVPHASSMAVCDLLGQYRVMGNSVPVNLTGQRRTPWRSSPSVRGALTSLRFFCWSMAKRNRAMTLSLLEDMMTMTTPTASAGTSPLKGPSRGGREALPTAEERGVAAVPI